jgi:membrane protein YqaA with SNARE-associated domain
MNILKIKWCFILFTILTMFGLTGFSEGTFLSGWILPAPSEVIIIGLFFLKASSLKPTYCTFVISNLPKFSKCR